MSFRAAEVGAVPSEWHVEELRFFLELITYGFTNPMPDAVEGPWKLTAKDVVAGRINYLTARRTTQGAFVNSLTDKSRPRIGDVLLTKDGSIGRVAVVDREGVCINQSVALLRPNQLIDAAFLKYLLSSPYYQRVMEGNSDGSTIKHIYITRVDKMQVAVPPLVEQRAILEIIGSIDDRVHLLRETNATLEAIAQALFKSWFVDFDPVRAKRQGLAPAGMDEATAGLFPDSFEESALGPVPKGWRVGTLGDVCVNPRVAAKPGDLPPQTPYFGLEHMPRRSIALASAGTAEGLESGKFWFERDDVLFGKLRPYFHKVGLAPTSGVCSTDILVVRPKVPSSLGFVAMHVSSDALIAHTTMLSNGARMPRTSWQDIAGFKVVLPPDEAAAEFNRVTQPLFERIYANIDAARTLGETRDTLLPRLISGQLRLPEAHPVVEEVA